MSYPFDYFCEEIKLDEKEQLIVDQFHKLYFEKLEQKSGLQISWLGHHTGKVPADLWRYQEIIFEYKPDFIVECGTYWGGSAIYMASIMDLINHGRIFSLDKYPKNPLPTHPRVTYFKGDSSSQESFDKISKKIPDNSKVLVILDSDHHAEHVYKEMKLFDKIIPSGGMMIVEDTFLGGNPSHFEYGQGPIPAIEKFLKENSNYSIEKKNERFLFTLNRDGFLRKN